MLKENRPVSEMNKISTLHSAMVGRTITRAHHTFLDFRFSRSWKRQTTKAYTWTSGRIVETAMLQMHAASAADDVVCNILNHLKTTLACSSQLLIQPQS